MQQMAGPQPLTKTTKPQRGVQMAKPLHQMQTVEREQGGQLTVLTVSQTATATLLRCPDLLPMGQAASAMTGYRQPARWTPWTRLWSASCI